MLGSKLPKRTASALVIEPTVSISVVVQTATRTTIGIAVTTASRRTVQEPSRISVTTVVTPAELLRLTVSVLVASVLEHTTATTTTATTVRQTAPTQMVTIPRSIVLVDVTLRVTAVAETEAPTLRRAKPIVQARTSILVQRSA